MPSPNTHTEEKKKCKHPIEWKCEGKRVTSDNLLCSCDCDACNSKDYTDVNALKEKVLKYENQCLKHFETWRGNVPAQIDFMNSLKMFKDALRGEAIALTAFRVRTEMREKSDKAIELAIRFGGIDGDHHKAWVIDQMVRALSGDEYSEIVRKAKIGEDGPETYRWNEGIAP